MYADFDIREAIGSQNSDLRDQKFSEAFQWAARSHAIALKASATSPWVSAALFYMGRVRVLQHRVPEAK